MTVHDRGIGEPDLFMIRKNCSRENNVATGGSADFQLKKRSCFGGRDDTNAESVDGKRSVLASKTQSEMRRDVQERNVEEGKSLASMWHTANLESQR